jgi:hypothetical protein
VTVRLYEREAAVAAVRRLLDLAFAGRGGALFVIAPAGLGKSSVLQMAVAQAGGRFDVRTGSGDAVETSLPYGLIGQVLGGEDERAVPGTAGDLTAASRFYDDLRRIRQAAADRPLLLALDDLHWADPDSLTFLHLLCRRAPVLPLAIVATARPWPGPALSVAEQLAVRGLADIQRLVPLTDTAARDLLRDRFGDLGEAADRVVAACDGNPLRHRRAAHLLAVLAAALPEDPGAEQAAAWADKVSASLPAGTILGPSVHAMGRDEPEDRVRTAYGDTAYARLAAVKHAYDPDNLFRFNQNIHPQPGASGPS